MKKYIKPSVDIILQTSDVILASDFNPNDGFVTWFDGTEIWFD